MKGRDKMDTKIKNKLAVSLALLLIASPIIAYAETNMEVIPISAEIEEVVPIMVEEEMPNYIEFNGKISNLNSKEDILSILAENDLENTLDKLVAHIGDDVLILDEETMDFIDKDDLKEGMEVSIYYTKDTIMLMSYPPQLSPNLVILRSDDVDLNIKVDKFNEDLIGHDNSLKLNINEDVELINLKGETIGKEDLANKDLVVFYTFSTRSIPAQTTPKKVIAIKNHEAKILDYLYLNEAKFELESKMHKNDDGELMVPLRQIAEALGFEVKWIQETKSVELVKDDHTASLTIGDSEYQYYDMIIDLKTAPELTESKSYVPVSFIQNILIANIEVTMDGVLEISK